MRGKFISYCYTKNTQDALTSNQFNNDSDFISAGWNKTGLYTPDNSPKRGNGVTGNDHFHFLAYGTYTPYNISKVDYGDDNIYSFVNHKFTNDISEMTSNPSMWYLWNSPINGSR
jgi:hypothetical protein